METFSELTLYILSLQPGVGTPDLSLCDIFQIAALFTHRRHKSTANWCCRCEISFVRLPRTIYHSVLQVPKEFQQSQQERTFQQCQQDLYGTPWTAQQLVYFVTNSTYQCHKWLSPCFCRCPRNICYSVGAHSQDLTPMCPVVYKDVFLFCVTSWCEASLVQYVCATWAH